MVITFAHQKGGVGKTTLAVNIAFTLMGEGISVAVVDLDKQGTITDLVGEMNLPLNLVEVSDLSELQSIGYDIVIVDTPPYNKGQYIDLFTHSDIVVIPTKPNVADILAIRTTVGMVAHVQASKPNLKACIAVNMALPKNPYMVEVTEHLASYDIPVLKTTIGNRVTYGRTLGNDGGVFSETNRKAQDEIKAITNEIINLL